MKKVILFVILLTVYVGIVNVYQSIANESVEIHGFISQGYLHSSDNNYMGNSESGTFQFNEMGLNFTTNMSEQLSLGIQFFARDLGEIGNDEINIGWAFAEYSFYEWLGIRVGKLKTPYGLYNEIWDMDMLRTSIILPAALYSESARDAQSAIKGGNIYGNIHTGALGSFSYDILYGTIDVGANSGTERLTEQRLGIDVTSLKFGETTAIKLIWDTPFDGLRFVGTIVQLSLAIDTQILEYNLNFFQSRVFSMEYLIGKLLLAFEYSITDQENNILLYSTGDSMNIEERAETYYISAAYRFTDWLEVGSYYSYDEDSNLPSDNKKDICITFRFDINNNWNVKLENHFFNGINLVDPNENETVPEEDWMLFAATLTFAF